MWSEDSFDSFKWFLVYQEPNPEDPLNKEAAEVLQSNRRLFEQNVAKSMRGGHIGSLYFERCLKWKDKTSNILFCRRTETVFSKWNRQISPHPFQKNAVYRFTLKYLIFFKWNNNRRRLKEIWQGIVPDLFVPFGGFF